jgi:tRNA pseudouridine55 synthase
MSRTETEEATVRSAPSGLILLDKPAGLTSHGAVMQVRRRLGTRRVGHTGTLDPFATGLLLALVGPSTRLMEYFHALPKTYEATLELGRETDTHDRTGETTLTVPWAGVTTARIEEALAGQVGDLLQTPPRFSAKQTGGRRAHEMARRGESVALEPVPVTVHDLDRVQVDLPRVSFRVRVSTGTYIRAIARDVGRALGAGAHLTALRRTAIGPFEVGEAHAPDAVDLAALTPPAEAISWLPARALGEVERADIRHGRSVPLEGVQAAEGGPVALVADGRLVAMAERRGDRLQPRKVLEG